MDVKRINDFVRNLDSAINITGITVYGVDDEGHSVKIDTEMLTNPKPTFTEASTRTNIVGSGESTTTLWGKVKKFFTDLKTVAFSGNYNDLNNTPEIKTVATTGVFSDLIDKNVSTGTVTFTEASSRTNIATGESQSTIFGKIKKFFTDLKAVAFSGNYNDLINRPFQNVFFTFPDYKKYALLIDVTDWYDNNTGTNYSYNLFANVFCVRTLGNCEPSGTFNVAAKANWTRGYLLKYSRNTYFSVAIVEYNSHKYIALYKSNNSLTNVYMHGYMTSLLSTPLYVTNDDVSIIFSGTEY